MHVSNGMAHTGCTVLNPVIYNTIQIYTILTDIYNTNRYIQYYTDIYNTIQIYTILTDIYNTIQIYTILYRYIQY